MLFGQQGGPPQATGHYHTGKKSSVVGREKELKPKGVTVEADRTIKIVYRDEELSDDRVREIHLYSP